MAKCDYCGTRILFGGVKDEDLRFCNEECHQQGFLLAVADQVPEDIMSEHVAAVHHGECPKCGGPGPIDVQTSYIAWSALIVTSWQSRPQVCCRSCGVKAKLGGALLTGVVGWWGFPWGIIATPIQISRNMLGLFSGPDAHKPSDQLANMVRINLAAQLVEGAQQRPDDDETLAGHVE